jgi:predicted amidophosphoribosyltransferase
VLDLLLPQRCLACGAGGSAVCARCVALLPRIGPPLCARCGAPTAWPVARCRECAGRRLAFASARAAVEYDDAVRRLVAGWKEDGLRRLASLAAELVADVVERPEAALLTFVPPDPDRRLRRGHHPAERLARALGARWDLPVQPLLRRPRAGPRQRGSSLAERRRNVRAPSRREPRRPPSASSTTSTRLARPPRPPPPRCGRPGLAASRWSHWRARSAAADRG